MAQSAPVAATHPESPAGNNEMEVQALRASNNERPHLITDYPIPSSEHLNSLSVPAEVSS